MKTEDILTLLNAGYTKEEIAAMDQPDPAPQPEPDPQPDQPDPAPQPEPDPQPDQPDPAPQDQSAGESPALAGIVKTLESMTKAMQQMNLRLSSVEQPKQETAEDILATIINPTYKKE